MKFGDTPLRYAEGAILAHSQRIGDRTFKKGIVLSTDDIAFMRAHDVRSVIAARLGKNDLDENQAAARLAGALATDLLVPGRAGRGRCNLIAEAGGLLNIDTKTIDRINRKNEAITVATVAPDTLLAKGDIAATVKIITFGVSARQVASCEELMDDKKPLTLHPLRERRIGLIQTTLPGARNNIIQKTSRVTADRISALGSRFAKEIVCPHTETDVARAIRDMADENIDILLILGASAIADRRDVVPQAVLDAGGAIEHFGMPVDPGNLMLLARRDEMHVLGIPGSARSPRLHGFDWILQRLVAGREVSGKDITAMGVGGLLKEIPSRPMPRKSEDYMPQEITPQISGLILAAGQSRRMGERNKMLVEIGGKPMVRHAAEAMRDSAAGPMIVVTGHQPEALRDALDGIEAEYVHNPNFDDGLSTSLKAGINALPGDADAVLIALGDMPGITAAHLNRLIEAFDPARDHLICVPTRRGKRGNPVLWGRRFFTTIANVSGDVGARHLIGEHADYVVEVPMDDDAILTDLDTPAALDAYLKDQDA